MDFGREQVEFLHQKCKRYLESNKSTHRDQDLYHQYQENPTVSQRSFLQSVQDQFYLAQFEAVGTA